MLCYLVLRVLCCVMLYQVLRYYVLLYYVNILCCIMLLCYVAPSSFCFWTKTWVSRTRAPKYPLVLDSGANPLLDLGANPEPEDSFSSDAGNILVYFRLKKWPVQYLGTFVVPWVPIDKWWDGPDKQDRLQPPKKKVPHKKRPSATFVLTLRNENIIVSPRCLRENHY